MSGVGWQSDGGGSDEPPDRGHHSYIAPPHIRTTGEIPAVTGEVPAAYLPDPAGDLAVPEGPGEGWPPGGSVVDRPAPAPPDWMSGVQVPELLVTRDLDGSELVRQPQRSVLDWVQRLVGLVLVAVLVAVVVLVLASSLSRF